MALAEEAFSSIGLTEAGAERAYGKLSRYTYNKDIYADVAAERHTLKLLSAHFEYSEGLIWVYYTQEGLDQNGERTTGVFKSDHCGNCAKEMTESGMSTISKSIHERACGALTDGMG